MNNLTDQQKIDKIHEWCQKKKVKCVWVIPHSTAKLYSDDETVGEKVLKRDHEIKLEMRRGRNAIKYKMKESVRDAMSLEAFRDLLLRMEHKLSKLEEERNGTT